TGPDAPFVASLGLFYSRTVDRVESQYIPDGGQQQLESGDVDYSVTVYAGPPPADRPDFRYLCVPTPRSTVPHAMVVVVVKNPCAQANRCIWAQHRVQPARCSSEPVAIAPRAGGDLHGQHHVVARRKHHQVRPLKAKFVL